MSLDDVRAEIDRIDDEMIVLLVRRERQVQEAAAYKRDDAAVRAPERRRALMARLRERAAAEGLAPQVVDATWTAMIDAFGRARTPAPPRRLNPVTAVPLTGSAPGDGLRGDGLVDRGQHP